MATIKRFHELGVWKKAWTLNAELNGLLLKKVNKRDFILMDQLRRAGISNMAGFADGFSRKGNREFIPYLTIAHGSLPELQSRFHVVPDLAYFEPPDFEKIKLQLEKVQRMLPGLVERLMKSNYRVTTFA